jgi:hypothetical protein
LAFNATINNEVVSWSADFGLLGPPQPIFAIAKLLDRSEISPFGPGPNLQLDETNPYAVVWAISQLYPEALLGGDVPDFEDILGPIDPDGIY